MANFSVTIKNWEKFNPKRKDVTHPHWFRLNNGIVTSPDLFDLTFEEKWIWISLLSLASQRQSETIEIEPKWFSYHTQTSETALISALDKLSRNECVAHTLRPRNANGTCTSRTRAATRHNKTLHNNTEQDITEQKNVSIERSPAADRCDASASPFSDDVVVFEFLRQAGIKNSTQILWLKTYEDPVWLKQEFLKILAWLDANPAKKPKRNYARFIGNWLSRGWEWHRKSIASNKVPEKSVLEVLQEMETGS